MIQVTIIRNRNGKYTGFDCIGHADYANAGKDIVCAGVSALVINTINSLDCYTEEKFSVDTDAETGKITVQFQRPAGRDAELFIKSLTLGLQGIQDNYGAGYITLKFKEV